MRNLQALIRSGLANAADTSWLIPVLKKFSVAIPSGLLQRMQETKSSALQAQFVPNQAELNILDTEVTDPISDDKYAPLRGIVHRYPDRCLLTPIFTCPVYCRFCFRKEKIGKDKALSPAELTACYAYIASQPNIWEVILTGGDPLILAPQQLAEIIRNLTAIAHVAIIRIHTRVPVVCPEKITAELLAALQLHRPVYIALHANHADEFSPEAEAAIARIVDAGLPMLSQSVLLTGVNDDEQVLAALMRKFVQNRIKPYYLHHPDMVQGTSHFRGSIAKGQDLVAALRGNYSGLCQPTYVLDIPGGYGKSPLGKAYVRAVGDAAVEGDSRCEVYEVLDYHGDVHLYR